MAWLLLLALAPQLIGVANADSCPGGDCAEAGGRSLLQKRDNQEELSFDLIPDVVERIEVVNGIHIYLKEVDGTPEAEALLQGGGDDQVKTWMLDLPESWSVDKVHNMSKTLADYGLVDEWEGEVDNIIIVKGTKSQISSFLSSNNLPSDAFVEQDSPLHSFPVPTGVGVDLRQESDEIVDAAAGVPWGLDRIDDKKGLDGSYSDYFSAKQGSGVNVYVLDTGVRTTHSDFGGRAFPAYDEYSSTAKVCKVTDTNCAADRQGHGTHCAGSIAGNTYGVAKKATIHAVKILSDRVVEAMPGSSEPWTGFQNLARSQL